jgi:hypothetical protein
MRTLVLCLVAIASCKKQEPVQQTGPVDTAPIVAATTSTTAPIVADPSALASASATPHEHTAAELEAEKNAAKREALREAAEFGMLGLINSADAGEFGAGGLGLTGIGEGGGRGEGIGLGNIGTIGGRTTPRDAGRPPSIRQGAITVNGRLPPEVIQRIVRQNFGRFRLCYESGLRSNPSLQGRVAVKYIIDRDGSVKGTPTDGGSDLPDQGVVQCVIRGFQNISYPQTEGGVVMVVYPLIFSPGS